MKQDIKDVNGDGYREDKNGKPFEVRIASMAGGDIAEPLAQFYIQQWKEIGIKGVLSTGRLIEFNSFYDKVQADDPEIDVFFAAWSVGTNLNPIEGGGRKSPLTSQDLFQMKMISLWLKFPVLKHWKILTIKQKHIKNGRNTI